MTIAIRIINFAVICFFVNSPFILSEAPLGLNIPLEIILTAYFLIFNVFPTAKKYPSLRLKVLGDGAELILSFWVSCTASAFFVGICIYNVVTGKAEPADYIFYAVFLFLAEAMIFWNGIIRVYVTSVQLGIKYRVLGLIFGMVPVANLIMLMIIYCRTSRECAVECEKYALDESRRDKQICKTRYPIVFVHGVFFRDSRLIDYWGRIPEELRKNGAVFFYGEQQSALSVKESSEELAAKIEDIVLRTGCGKVNIIAHSKGGLDARYAITKLGCDKYVASLTTVNTPHKGCIFAEYLLNTAPKRLQSFIEKTYNKAFYKLGDDSPDFMAAVRDLTASACEKFNEEVPDSPEVMYQSVGSKASNRRSGRFPLNISYPLVKRYDGDNDGLVALSSTKWGEKFIPVFPVGKRGITHADVVDLNREDIKGFDVREFYVQLVSELKERGF